MQGAFGAAADRLQRGPVTPILTDDLLERAVRAEKRLEIKEP